MNKQQAYNSFWRRFGVLAFEENSVPDDETIQKLIDSGVADSKFPYITYQVLLDNLGNPVFPTASIYDKSTSWETADLLSNEIMREITNMNAIRLDEGYMYITTGTPFAQHRDEPEDSSIKRIILNLGIEFLTEY